MGVDGGDRLLPGQDPGDHHHRRADDGHARPVHAEARKAPEGEAQIGADEGDQRDDAQPAEIGHDAGVYGSAHTLATSGRLPKPAPARSLAGSAQGRSARGSSSR